MRGTEQSVAKNAVAMVLAEAGIEFSQTAQPIIVDISRSLGALLARAQATGAVCADVGVDGVFALLVGVARAAEFLQWDHHRLKPVMADVCEGLRPAQIRQDH